MKTILNKPTWSGWALIFSVILAVVIRIGYYSNNSTNGYNATSWDALGYYIYLPGLIIYDDVKDLDWFHEIDATYNVSGGQFYQAVQLENGDHVFKYLGGVAILELPFFLIGHAVALATDYPADGFSAPYQYAIIWGAVLWFLFGLWILKWVLRRYFTDGITALTLLLVVGASNLIQYVSVDGAMSHSFIFPLYALLLYFTIKWHDQPKRSYFFFIGLIIGLATISRPTELIMIFIPLLWGMNHDARFGEKWKVIMSNKIHLVYGALGGFLGLLPQLLYWKHAAGTWVFDVGSKWFFLNPWWRVLFGFEKGWFIYTPIAIFFVIGLFLMKGKPFRKAVLTFCLLNIWIIISWSDWRYGASYSTRALTQSYPIFALALAAILERVSVAKWRLPVLLVGSYLVVVNLFQIWQYNALILHYNDMNFNYYKAIYLDPSPSPLDYSLLDTDEVMPKNSLSKQVVFNDTISSISLGPWEGKVLATYDALDFDWLTSNFTMLAEQGLEQSFYVVRCFENDSIIKESKFRLAVPQFKHGGEMKYQNHVRIPAQTTFVEVKMESLADFEATIIHEIRYRR
jgi:hypothetical protein